MVYCTPIIYLQHQGTSTASLRPTSSEDLRVSHWRGMNDYCWDIQSIVHIMSELYIYVCHQFDMINEIQYDATKGICP